MARLSHCARSLCLTVFIFLAGNAALHAREGQPPYSWSHPTKLGSNIPEKILPSIDREQLLANEARAEQNSSNLTKRLRIAVPNEVNINPQHDGLWEALPNAARLWRYQIKAAGATDLHFGFSAFKLPPGATLHFSDIAHTYFDGPYLDSDLGINNQFWSPLVPGETVEIELYLPAHSTLAEDAVRLSYVGSGYRDMFWHSGGPGEKASGNCNIDVVCPLGDQYRNEVRAVARYTFRDSGGTYLCSGTLVMDQPRDFKNYFLTANHCIDNDAAAASMTLYWNYQSATCGAHGGGSLAQSQTGGALYRASRTDVDFSLVELNSAPPTSYNVYYAGWDVSGIAVSGSIGIHHPSGDVKAITQNTLPLLTTNSCIGSGGINSHWQTGPYAQGTTEGGSSGSAIFVPAGDSSGHQNLIVGTLSGGEAACAGSVPNNFTDCYGKLSSAWSGGVSNAQRLQPWLDPNNTHVQTVSGGEPGTTIGSPLMSRAYYYQRPVVKPHPIQ